MEARILTEDLRNHPAVEAWASATSVATVPECIHVFREEPRKSIYWLPGVAPGGTAVFAKRSWARRTIIERTVYEEILPRLPVTAPRYYGSLLTEPHGWIFLEDVGRHRYSREEPQDLAFAARWVGTLHVTAAQVSAGRSLPNGGPARYLTHLRDAVDTINRSLDRWPYPEDQAAVLSAVLSRCGALEARWDGVEAKCEGAPVTVVHGDFQSKNVYLRTDNGSTDLLPIDWETVGWGTPATDLADLWLARVDLETYWTVVREAWPEIGLPEVERLAAMGRLLSGCAALHWECATLHADTSRGRRSGVIKIGPLSERLERAARAIGILE